MTTPPAALQLHSVERGAGTGDPGLHSLARRVLSPWTGLTQSIGFVLRGEDEPRFVVAGAQLTGVHVLAGRETPATYHLGGCGIFRDEALIRCIGETVERYGQLVAPESGHLTTRFTSHRRLRESGAAVLPDVGTDPYAPGQYSAPGFPYRPLDEDAPLTWVRASLLSDESPVWVPAQLLLIGYRPRRSDGEPWLSSAITTGSAAHTDPAHAHRGALMELIQVDAAMGHWYSGTQAPRISLDDRTRALEAVLDSRVGAGAFTPSFHWLHTPGFDVHAVACVMRGDPDVGHGVSVGLGADTRLDTAMYKALLEASATVQLAKMLRVSPNLTAGASAALTDDPARMLDLDSNVAYYATPGNSGPIDARFPDEPSVAAGDLPPDSDASGTASTDTDTLLRQAREQGVRLAQADCTTADIAELGFVVTRVWTPDLLLLCLPSAPPLDHPRLALFGGADRVDPHPYA